MVEKGFPFQGVAILVHGLAVLIEQGKDCPLIAGDATDAGEDKGQ